jgi:hypothetical protein
LANDKRVGASFRSVTFSVKVAWASIAPPTDGIVRRDRHGVARFRLEVRARADEVEFALPTQLEAGGIGARDGSAPRCRARHRSTHHVGDLDAAADRVTFSSIAATALATDRAVGA